VLDDAQRALVDDTAIQMAKHGAAKYFKTALIAGLRCATFDDFFSSALFGLVRAAGKWKPGRAKFTTYAFHWTDAYLRIELRRITKEAQSVYAVDPQAEVLEG